MTSPLNLDAERAAILAAARALADRSAEACNVDKDDKWKIYCDDFIADAEAALLAARSASAEEQPVAVVDANDDGLFVDILYGPDGSPLKIGEKLYRAAPAAAAGGDALTKLRARIDEMQEASYTYGEFSKDAVCIALDGVKDEIDALAQTAAPAEAVEPQSVADERRAFEEYWNSLEDAGATEAELEMCEYAAWQAWQTRPRRCSPLPAAPAAHVPAAARDVLAERQRQVSVEGWTPEHDDQHGECSMSYAAACYALANTPITGTKPYMLYSIWKWTGWSWDSWFKPKDRRRNLVRSGALILAEIERLDRAALAAAQPTNTGDAA